MNLFKKLAFSLIVLASTVILVSSIIYLAPVDPARLTFGQRTDAASIERKQAELYLDRPLYEQMLLYLNDLSPLSINIKNRYQNIGVSQLTIIHGNKKDLVLKWPYLRTSYQSGRPVSEMLKSAIPRTFILAIVAMMIAVVFGILLGAIAALRQDSWVDQSILTLSTLGISVPSYVSAILLALVFGYVWRDWTGLNIQGSIYDINDVGDEVIILKNLILPAIALGVRPLSIITQLMRSALLDVISMDYIRTATSKGLSFAAVIRKHALKNALNPVFTAVTGWFASLLAGAFFVEHVFNFRGLGDLTVNALIHYDIPVVLACVLFVSLIFVIINIVVDYGYTVFDPKVKKG